MVEISNITRLTTILEVATSAVEETLIETLTMTDHKAVTTVVVSVVCSNYNQPQELIKPNWDEELPKLPTFEKNFYVEHESVRDRSDSEIAQFRKENEMTISGHDIPKPITTFDEAGFPDYVLNEVKAEGFDKPTGIQCQGWPMALSGRDMVGIAATGSGKHFVLLFTRYCSYQRSTIIGSRRWTNCFGFGSN